MRIVLYETAADYEREYQAVRGALIAKGTSLNRWLAERGHNRQLAYQALLGRSHGPKARALRATILREVLSEAA